MNTNILKKKLNIFKTSLNDINLIEASAGTGKTFTIVLLYLRLLLGIGKKGTCIKKLLVHEILVVTFTNAAKEELYIRIKDGIKKLYLTCINKTNQDPIFVLFLKEINNIEEAIYILKKAQNNINNFAIYTIHGFCQNILQLHTFHLNVTFQDKIIENENSLYLRATQDFWRYYFYNLPENITKIIYKDYHNPDYLLKKIKPLLGIKSINFKNKFLKNETLISYYNKNIKKINDFKIVWLIHYQIILNTINNLKINKRIYSKHNLSKWIKNITIWAKTKTEDYTIPVALKYFTKKNIEKNTTNNICSKYIIFKEVEKIFNNTFSLKKIIIFHAIKNINKFLLKEKKKKSLLGFNDLLSILLTSIKKDKCLRDLIRKKYPAAFIDEFQDTDIQQYEIFNIIYKKNKETGLFLIGDPKQAIYSFRGADIFSYLYAKSQIKKHFYLDTNWRSSINMCKSINYLFSQNNNPFIFKNISFESIEPSYKNSEMKFTIDKISQIPITFFLQEKKEVCIDEYQIWISKQCANEISYWLTAAAQGRTKIIIKNGEKKLEPSDIAVLVRNQKEANLIKKELKKLNIESVYSSRKNSIFQTFDAQELLWILESILEPDNRTLLKQSISTHILKKLLFKMKEKLTNERSYFIIEKLYEYHDLWKKTGIFYMIKTMILEYQINANSIEINTNYLKNLNFLHIAELLQEKFTVFNREKSLIHWFQKKILNKEQTFYEENIRSLTEFQSINIITIHKSKGLEYPIVWIPFSMDFHESKLPIYHDKKNFKVFFDLKENSESFKLSDEERLAEDIRFIYVALTRSIVHCSIGIACLKKKKIKDKKIKIHKSGLGYIIQNGKEMNYENLLDQLNKLSINNLIELKYNINNFTLPMSKKTIYLISKPTLLIKNINRSWNLTSFTNLSKENKLSKRNIKDCFLENFSIKTKERKNKILTIHNFPMGKQTGLMIHFILKNLQSLKKKKYDWFSAILEKYNIPLKWTEVLISWINQVINTPLTNKKIVLSEINKKLCTKELEFFFPIKNTLYSEQLNKIIQSFDRLSMLSEKLFFNPITGIVKGVIDLVFLWKEKYYILDYKSNWLGENDSFYSDKNIKKEMIKQRYDLQYQIYTIAIDRFLTKKIKNYNYKNNFGGIIYFFLRAIKNYNKNNGVFYTIPNYSLIENINTLIS